LITNKENFLMLMHGQIPAFLPKYDLIGWRMGGNPFGGKTEDGYNKDEFGIVYQPTEDGLGGALPKIDFVLLDDITRWRDVIKAPDVDSIDWERFAKEQMSKRDTVTEPVIMAAGDYFIKLMNFMTFTEGLCALVEEPEECTALFEYLSEYHIEMLKKQLYYFKPDVIRMGDDIAADSMPFIDLKTYRTMIKPHHKKLSDFLLENEMPMLMHCCGVCDIFVDDWVEMGITGWEPAQAGNDFVGIKKKFNNKFAIFGGWDNTGPISLESTEEEMRAAIIEYVDTLAPGGGFAYYARVAHAGDREYTDRRNAICDELYETYARDWYKNH